MPQGGIVYRYFCAFADHDISADPFALSIDAGDTWVSAGVVLVAVADLPPAVAAVNASTTPPAGCQPFWYRALTGPGTAFPMPFSSNAVLGHAGDDPETPQFGWLVTVGPYE